MDITVTVSDEIGKVISQKAEERDMGLADLAGDLLEEKVKEDYRLEDTGTRDALLAMAGMFSSGKTDTSARYKEILRDAVRMPGGFGGGE
jgi:hypothetical protein